MPWTLYRFILLDMTKLLVLSSLVLTVVISLAVAVKPLSEGLLSAEMLLRFSLFSAPMILRFSLPFSAAFAAAVTFSRMSNDNEILACASCGLSYRLVILPVLAMGLVLSLTMFWLSNTVVPTFYGQAQRLATRDFLSLMVNKVRQQEAVRIGDRWWVYADAADDSLPPPADLDTELSPSKMIVLRGVAVGKTGPDGDLMNESTADRAVLLLFNDEEETWVTLRLQNVQAVGVERLAGATEQADVTRQRLPNPFRDRVDFKTLSELRELGRDPSVFRKVRDFRRTFVSQLAEESLLRKVERELSAGRVTLRSGDRLFHLHAPSIERDGSQLVLTATADGPVNVSVDRIEPEEAGQPPRVTFVREMTAGRAVLQLSDDDTTVGLGDSDNAMAEEPRLSILLSAVRISGEDGTTSNEVKEVVLGPARHRDIIRQPLSKMAITELVQHPLVKEEKLPNAAAAVERVRSATIAVVRDIVAQYHLRAAHAGTCALALLASVLIAIRERGGLPLAVFFKSFAMTAGTLVLVLCGKTLITSAKFPIYIGVTVCWVGILAMSAYLLLIYLRIQRN